MLTPKEFEKAVKENEKRRFQNWIKVKVALTSKQKVDLIMTKIIEDMKLKAKGMTEYHGKLDFIYPIDSEEFDIFLPFTEEDRSTLDDELSEYCWQIDNLMCSDVRVKMYKNIFIRIKSLLDEE